MEVSEQEDRYHWPNDNKIPDRIGKCLPLHTAVAAHAMNTCASTTLSGFYAFELAVV